MVDVSTGEICIELRTFEPVNGYDINRFIAETAYAIVLLKCLCFVLQSWVELQGAIQQF